MRKRIALAAAVCALLGTTAGARMITEKDLFAFHWIGDPQLSPDGSRVAYVQVTVDAKQEGYETTLWMVPSRPGEPPRRLTNGPRDSSPRWSPDGRTIAFLRAPAGEKDGKPQPAQIWLLPLSGGEPRALTSMPKAAEGIAWSPDGGHIAFTAATRPSDFETKAKAEGERESDVRVINQAVYRSNASGYEDPTRTTHVWSIAVADAAAGAEAKPTQLTTGDFDEQQPQWSPDGSRIYFLSQRAYEPYYDTRGPSIYSIRAAGGEPALAADIAGPIQTFAVSPDGKWIAFTGYQGEPVHSYDQTDLWVVGSSSGAKPRNLTSTYDQEILGGLTGDQRAPRGAGRLAPVWSADGQTIYVTSSKEGRTDLLRVDAASGRLSPWTHGNHDLQAFAVRGGAAVALVSTPTKVGDLHAVDAAGALSRLTDVNGELFGQLKLTEPEELWYTSFDGKKVETWVQRPPDFDPAKRYPLILDIHGGPHAAYGYTFDHEFQWMAAKGYVVVYPNPRGSTSYGGEFANVIQYHYPGDDAKDLLAAVDAVIAKGWADPKKLGVTGGSGGGVLTNWIITQTDRFLAAVSQRSIADWSTFWYTADFDLFQPSWFRKAPWQDPEDFAQRSAITHVERVKTPLMLIEGEADWRTPPMAGGEMMFRALKYLRRPAVMVRFPDESHELSRSGKPWHRVERLQHIMGWFDKWILGQGGEQYEVQLRK